MMWLYVSLAKILVYFPKQCNSHFNCCNYKKKAAWLSPFLTIMVPIGRRASRGFCTKAGEDRWGSSYPTLTNTSLCILMVCWNCQQMHDPQLWLINAPTRKGLILKLPDLSFPVLKPGGQACFLRDKNRVDSDERGGREGLRSGGREL